VCHHLRPAPAGLGRFFDLGYLGVDLFAFLSGFVIAHHYATPLARQDVATTARYLWVRAVRIFPLHWFALALLVVARFSIAGFGERPADRERYDAVDLVQQILMVHGWGIADRFAWNLPSWTVSSEWLCYLVFPLAAPWIARARSGACAAALAVACLALTTAALFAVGHADFNTALDYGWLRIGGEFATGCWLQRAWAHGFARGAGWAWIGPAAIGVAVVFAVLEVPAGVVASFAVLVYALAQDRGPLARALSVPPFVFLGEASYAIYLMHWVVLRVLLYTGWAPIPLTGRPGAPGIVAIDLAIVVAVSVVAHLTVDAPLRRRLRRLVAPV
jgi:peptidoglycan/LPS O-acetylase OafA/YrhL